MITHDQEALLGTLNQEEIDEMNKEVDILWVKMRGREDSLSQAAPTTKMNDDQPTTTVFSK
jgi:hypothetical protein